MRDPLRLVDGNDHPELKRLLLAAKKDGPPPPAGAKQRVQAAALAHMRARDEVRQSGVRRIGTVAMERELPIHADKPRSTRPRRQERSWTDEVLAFFAIAAAFAVVVLVARHAYVTYAEHAHPKASPRSVDIPAPEKPMAPEVEKMDDHRASITVIEEPAPLEKNEVNVTVPEDVGPARELVLRLKHRAHKYGTPQIIIRSSCSDPNDWLRNTEMDYPTEAYNAGISGTMNVSCNLNADGSFSGCVAQRPPGFTAGDTGKVLMTMNSWTLAQSMADWTARTRRCKIDVIFDIGGDVKTPELWRK
jgi:hypothetical protein